MASNRSWKTYEATYRAKEMKVLANWIMAGLSGAVVGLPGCGRSNLLGFLCNRVEVMKAYLPVRDHPFVVVPVDLNDLLINDLSTFYRIFLRAFYRYLNHLDPEFQTMVTELYQQYQAEPDFFVVQSAIYDLLKAFQERQVQVVLVLNRFEDFYEAATVQMLNALRGLRDNFRDTLSFFIGMPQAVAYLANPTGLGNMYELLDNQVCWVGPMSDADAQAVITQETFAAQRPLPERERAQMLQLTGRFPALLKAVCGWWLTQPERPPLEAWTSLLLVERSVQHRLSKIWNFLTQEEQYALTEIQKMQGQLLGKPTRQTEAGFKKLTNQYSRVMEGLVIKGVCEPQGNQWRILGDLLDGYIRQSGQPSRGRIWQDDQNSLFQGNSRLNDLTELQDRVLTYFLAHPHKKLTHTDIIYNSWPDRKLKKGVAPESLYTLIKELRSKIEPGQGTYHYIVNWRGEPEGGYQFFPEGRPDTGGA